MVTTRHLVLVLVLAWAGCVDADVQVCDSGKLCPAGDVCTVFGCADPEQVQACEGLGEGAVCALDGQPIGVCLDGACAPQKCGDGIVTGLEQCDGTDLGDVTGCQSLDWYDDGEVTCTAQCTYDESACQRKCGDGVIDVDHDERCDAANLGSATDCLDLGFLEAGTLTCNSICEYDVAQCEGYCGDGVVAGQEECDGNAVTCQSLGYYDPGTAACTALCRHDTSSCTGSCGDDILNGPGVELCDGGPPLSASCLDYGHDAGPLGCSEFCTPDFAGCEDVGWRRFATLGDGYFGIWGAAPDDVYAGGGSGGVVHWDGTAWSAVDVEIGGAYAVWGSSSTDVFVVGTSGDIGHYDGAAWTVVSFPVAFYAVAGSGPTDVYAVGSGGVHHYDGTSWSVVAAVPGGDGVWAIAPDDVYVVGNYGAMHWDGSAWSTITQVGGHLISAWASGPTDVYLAGYDGALYHGSGTTWQQVQLLTSEGLLGVRGTGPDDVYAVGDWGGVYHYDGVAWAPMAIAGQVLFWWAVWPTGPDEAFASGDFMWRYQGASKLAYQSVHPAAMLAIGGTSATDVFVVGQAGTIVRHDGVMWTQVPSPTSADLTAIWKVTAVGKRGTILRWDGSAWNAVTSGTTQTLEGVWGASATDLYAVGDGVVLHSSDGTTWSPVTVPTTKHWYAVTGASATDVWIVGEGGAALHLTGTVWSSSTIAGAGDLFAAWAGGGEVWAAGNNGVVKRFTGSWATVASGTTSRLTSIAGVAANDLAIASGEATYLHWNGSAIVPVSTLTTSKTWTALWQADATHLFAAGPKIAVARKSAGVWSDELFPGGEWYGLWASGADDIYVVDSSSGTLIHHDGALWSRLAFAAGYVWGTARDDVYAHDGTAVQRWDGTTWSALPDLPAGAGFLGGSAGDVWANGTGGVSHLEGSSWVWYPIGGADWITSISGTSSSDVWVVDGTNLRHWNGTAWSVSMTHPDSYFQVVWAYSASVVFASDHVGAVWRWDGATWTRTEISNNVSLDALDGSAPDDVYAGGSNGTLFRFDGTAWSPVRVNSEISTVSFIDATAGEAIWLEYSGLTGLTEVVPLRHTAW